MGIGIDEKEELKQKLQEELNWVKYRNNMLGIIEVKLLQMKQLAKQTKEGLLSQEEMEAVNIRINNLAAQINAIYSESRKLEDREIIE